VEWETKINWAEMVLPLRGGLPPGIDKKHHPSRPAGPPASDLIGARRRCCRRCCISSGAGGNIVNPRHIHKCVEWVLAPKYRIPPSLKTPQNLVTQVATTRVQHINRTKLPTPHHTAFTLFVPCLCSVCALFVPLFLVHRFYTVPTLSVHCCYNFVGDSR
jgi:hypothetical protein